MIKVINESYENPEWEHVCYMDKELYQQFLKERNAERYELAEFLCRWAKEDFNVDLSMSKKSDIIILKHLVRDFYKRAHPELYIDSETDRQGWIRVWITKKIREELNIHDTKCF